MFKRFTAACVSLVQKYLPDAYIFAILLTILTFVLSMISTGQTPLALVQHWGNGFWSLLGFTMQMALVLVLGNALASSKPVKKLLIRIASIANTPTQAIMLVSFVSAIACWFNWGFGLIVGALLAKELAKRVPNVDYRLLIAAAYSGFVVWHAGISGSVPLTIASDAAEVSKVTLGAVNDTIPVSRTLFSLPNLIMSWLIILTLPFINRAMQPDADKVIVVDPALLVEEEEEIEIHKDAMTPADKLENNSILSLLVVVLGGAFLVLHFVNNGFDLNLDIVNLIFLVLGVAFHRTPIRYVRAINEAVKGAGGILLQFPFYAGIMGLMTGANAEGVSLASNITELFLSFSTPKTFNMFTFWSAGLINVFVPSGGGQWAVQGPIAMPAAVKMGLDPAITTMAVAWGDAWTNMLQPFWALPALGIAKLSAKDIMGYCVIVLLYVGIIISLGFFLWASFL
ncbi:short-chain fatty acid transporter [Peptoniphilus sp. KCTC 25270]|uniref:short-chain fatty acid transporter n=1 Tax=Peptoniphilus sp. KCTC 25270 TaxID=2897414 RepID=UPI001E6007DF|nr:short-chain fatty acid transporter [Peptoniphilus sp. KCTC 25270]MCD1147625.1 short-chain fatty acid transporter [Peptoniphilus sp. KCTC 25270]